MYINKNVIVIILFLFLGLITKGYTQELNIEGKVKWSTTDLLSGIEIEFRKSRFNSTVYSDFGKPKKAHGYYLQVGDTLLMFYVPIDSNQYLLKNIRTISPLRDSLSIILQFKSMIGKSLGCDVFLNYGDSTLSATPTNRAGVVEINSNNKFANNLKIACIDGSEFNIELAQFWNRRSVADVVLSDYVWQNEFDLDKYLVFPDGDKYTVHDLESGIQIYIVQKVEE